MTAAPSHSYLDPATLATVGALDLRARMVVEGVMTGMHRSPYQGFSVEFAQHRQYAPGDDIRHLDWKVFGRTDKLYLKQYQQETNLDLVLMVDCSSSMGYSSVEQTDRRWSKYDHAATTAAALTYLATQQQDRVGLVVFADHINTTTRMSNTRDHAHAVAETLATERPPEGMTTSPRSTDIARLFDEVLAKLTQHSMIVLISDLFDDPESIERCFARVQHRRHDLLIFQTLDPAERTFPFRTPSDFLGMEGEGKLGLDPPALRRGYLAALNEHQRKIDEAARRFRFDRLMLDTGESLGPPLSHFLARRAAQLRRG